MSWLSGWAKRRKITIDNTNIDSDLDHFPVPVPLGTSVGQSDQDVSDIFDELGSESLKIAVTKSDGETEIYAEVEQWDATNEKALLWVSKSDLTLTAASVTELYIYYDSSQSDNTDYIGAVGLDIKLTLVDGLFLEPDTSPYTGTTLSVGDGIIDGNLWSGQLGDDIFWEHYSYGVDLGEA